MGIRFAAIVQHTKQILRPRYVNNHQFSAPDVPKGHFAVYVGESQKNRFVVPISYLSHPLFQDLLRRAEEEYGFDHPTGPLTIPCSKDTFLSVTALLSVASHLSDY